MRRRLSNRLTLLSLLLLLAVSALWVWSTRHEDSLAYRVASKIDDRGQIVEGRRVRLTAVDRSVRFVVTTPPGPPIGL